MNKEQMSPEQLSREKAYRKRLKRVKRMKMKFLFMSLLGQDRKMNWLVKNHIFGMIGEKVLYQPNTLPNEPELIRIHNNVRIAANVTFYTHDVINMMFATFDNEPYIPHRDCIEIYDNCFIGGNSTILGGVAIGPDSVVAAGSVVTKDVPPGKIVGGNPAKVIGEFEALHQKRRAELGTTDDIPSDEELWERFYSKRK